ncbi:MAG: hypothetical protein QXJ68_05865 [Methanocellales archaeon]
MTNEEIWLPPWSVDEIEEEVRAVKERVTLWKECYIEQGILDEETLTCFQQEIDELVYPYVRRMCDLGIFTIEQAQEILDYSERELEELKRIAARRKFLGISKVEFYYSSKIEPIEGFKLNIESCLNLLKELEAKRIRVKAIDTNLLSRKELKEKVDSLMNIQDAGVFSGEAKMEWFGRELPVLLLFEWEFDSDPKEIYPRRENDKLIGCEEALQLIVDKLKAIG